MIVFTLVIHGFGFLLKLQTRYQLGSRCSRISIEPKTNLISFPLGIYGSGRHIKKKKPELCLSIVDTNQGGADGSVSDTNEANAEPQANVDNGSMLPGKSQPASKKSLTARERLRAARVLSRYAESKPVKQEMGSKVLDALRESDKGKNKSGLPEAPTNIFDDSKRGMPKAGLTFSFPGGFDLFLIIFSFVFISTVMFATTFVVWKVGAIHFNDS